MVTNQRIRNINHDGTANSGADISLSGISNRPRGLEIDRDESLLFVLDDQNDEIRVFDEDGRRPRSTDEILDEDIFRINGSGFGTFALSLKSYDLDRTGQLYVELEGHSNQPDIGVNLLIENLSRIGDD